MASVFLIAPVLPTMPTFAAKMWSCHQNADGTMQCLLSHEEQETVCNCLTAVLNLIHDSHQDASL